MTQRRVEIQAPMPHTWNSLLAGAGSLGRVEEQHPASKYFLMKARYGLNPVRLRVSVMNGPTEQSSVVEITGRGQDVWGVASRKVIDRLLATLD
jgi:hypothetical protein